MSVSSANPADVTTDASSVDVAADTVGAANGNATAPSTTTQTVAYGSIVFDNTYGAGVSTAYQSCILSAEQQIASIWHNGVTISIQFDAAAPGLDGTLATNTWSTINVTYAGLKNALTSLSAAEPNNTYLQQAVAHLPATDPTNGAGFHLPVDYAGLLGISGSYRGSGNIVTLNTSYNWSYGQDVINTLEHEISEGAMGRVGGLGDQNTSWSTMDLLRYSAAGQADYSDGRDGQAAYFSYDGGTTLSALSFNNEFNSQGVQVNNGDTADFTQQDVFGTGRPGETDTLSQTDVEIMDALGWNPDNTPPPSATANMIMVERGGSYEIYDLGNNTVLGNYALTQAAWPWQAVGYGNFSGTETADMLLRNTSTGALQVDDVSNNNVTQTATFGAVGLEWSVAGFGKFDSSNYSDMMMRNTSGAYDVFTVRNNQIVGANTIAAVGADWQTAGFGDFNGDGTTDMLLRNSNSGAFEYYNIVNGQITSAGALGQESTDWQVVGFGNFDNSGFSDMIMHDSTDGAYDLFTIRNDQIVSSQEIAAVGSDWQFAGFADVNGDGTTDMLLRNANSGAFEYYDIVNGQVTAAGVLGQVGTQWTVSGVAPDKITATDSANANAGAPEPAAASAPSAGDTLVGGAITQVTDEYPASNGMTAFGSGLPAGAGSLDASGTPGEIAGTMPGFDGGQSQGWLASIADLPNAAQGWLAMQATAPQTSAAGANDAIQAFVPSVGAFEAGAAALDTPSPAVGVEPNGAMAGLASNLLHQA